VTNLPVGLLINFNVELLSQGGVRRVINSRYKPQSAEPPVVDRGESDAASEIEEAVTEEEIL